MNIRHPLRIMIVSILVAWCFDLLFWNKPAGVSFPIIICLFTAAGLLLTLGEKQRPVWRGLILIAPILLFSVFFAIRQEPFTLFVDGIVSLVSLALLACTLLGGRWVEYSLTDFVVNFTRLIGSALSNTPGLLKGFKRESTDVDVSASKQTGKAVLRGVLLAAPVLIILIALLSSADEVFGQGVKNLFSLIQIDRFGEYLVRFVYILVLAYVLAGVFTYAIRSSHDETLTGVDQPWLKPFLGWTETLILLGSVDLLFVIFVTIQFRYFFGGQSNIQAAGFTYSEYARRGFSELVAVAVISLGLALSLNSVSVRSTTQEQSFFNGLVVLLVGLVIVILVSAFERLMLYESAYGFSRLRTYTHIFIPWLGVLLLATAALIVLRRPRVFAFAAFLCVIGFGLSLNILNVDALITRQNIRLTAQGRDLDGVYLSYLSDDNVPVLVAGIQDASLPTAVRQGLSAALKCRLAAGNDPTQPAPWPSYNLSHNRAASAILSVQAELNSLKLTENTNHMRQVQSATQTWDCY